MITDTCMVPFLTFHLFLFKLNFFFLIQYLNVIFYIGLVIFQLYFKQFFFFVRLGVYGDVLRVKILYNKKDGALVQMAEPHQAHLGQSLEYIIIILIYILSTIIFFFFLFYLSLHLHTNISHASFGQSASIWKVHTSNAIQVPDCSTTQRGTTRLRADKRLHLVAVTPIQEAGLQKLPKYLSTVVHSSLI